jgi:hypothetical protein
VYSINMEGTGCNVMMRLYRLRDMRVKGGDKDGGGSLV